MIFSKFFKKKKWLSDKVSERLAAVAELDVDLNENKSILHELAFNDADEKVRRATLEKLNDFSLWWQAFKNDESEAIKKYAERIIIESLTDKKQTNLDDTLKRQFILECNKTQLLEKVVFDLNNDELTVTTIEKINKENIYFKAITDSNLSDSLKSGLLSKVEETNQLKKLAKKLQGQLLAQVETKLIELKEAEEKPIKLEKQVRLLLAQFNALKDKSDFAEVEQKQQSINRQWLQVTQDFAILPAEIVSEINEKFESISNSLERIHAPIKEAWQKELAAKELAETKSNNNDKLQNDLATIESKVTQSIADDQDIDQSIISSEINRITHQCNELELNTSDKESLLKRAESIFNRANQVPQIKAAIVKAKEMLTSLKELTLPTDLQSLNEINPIFKSLRNDWQNNLKEVGIALPSSIAEEYQASFSQWQKAVSELEKDQRQLFNQTRRKMTELESLVSGGKFHSAFGLYKKLTFWIADLNDYQKNQIERKWDQLEQEVGKLQELEKSFSNPKKQELIADIRKLAESPLVDATEQAHRVRLLRSNWQSLGHAGDEEESTLNDEFNELCEQAFSPCREHYKELEDERQNNLNAKLLLVEQLETLAQNLKTAEVKNWREVESMFIKLSKLWRETGLIDREKVAEINKRYHSAIKPIKQAITNYHSENEQKKQDLIIQAKQIAEQELDVSVKSEKLKSLQAKWQKVGFAGRNTDQQLWNEFRAVNNPIFEQRDSVKKEEQQQAQVEFEQHITLFNELTEKLQQVSEISEIREITVNSEDAFKQVKGLGKQQFEKLRRTHQSIIKIAEDKVTQIRAAQEQQVFVDLFAAVEKIANGESADLSSLKPAWQTAINATSKKDRNELTLQLEITAGIDSPANEKEARNNAQMKMLTSKLEQGTEFNSQDLLEQWLTAGIFQSADLALLKRIKPIFIS